VFFGGKPLWHVSVAIWSRLTNAPKPCPVWTDQDRSRADRIAEQLLAGVGIADQARTDDYGIARHYRRATTPDEQDAVFRSPKGRLAALRQARGY